MKRIAAICAMRPIGLVRRRTSAVPDRRKLRRAGPRLRHPPGEAAFYFLSHGQPWPGLVSCRDSIANLFGIGRFRDRRAIHHDLRAAAMTLANVSGPMPPASETRKPRRRISSQHRYGLSICRPRAVHRSGNEPRHSRNSEARRILGQEFGLAGLGDGLDDDGAPKALARLLTVSCVAFDAQGSTVMKEAPAPNIISASSAPASTVLVSAGSGLGPELAGRRHGRDAEALQHRRADLDNVGKRPYLSEQCEMLRVIESNLQEHVGLPDFRCRTDEDGAHRPGNRILAARGRIIELSEPSDRQTTVLVTRPLPMTERL